MITYNEIRPLMYDVNGTLKGVLLYNNEKMNAEMLKEQIIEDLQNFDLISKIKASVNVEVYNESRTYYDCGLIEIHLLIKLTKNDKTILDLIKKYLESAYVSPITTK